MISNYITTAGLIFDIIGVVLLFKHGFFSSKQFKILGGIIKESNKQKLKLSNEEPDIENLMKLVKFSKRYSSLAMSMIILGFLLQIIGNMIKSV